VRLNRLTPAFVLACALSATPLLAQAPAPAQTPAPAPPDATALAKQQQNPISSLVSIPLQFNFNTGGGLEDQGFFLLNVQPVIPFRLNDGWNAVSRTVVPIASMPGPEGTHSSGIGDIQMQLYLTPSKSQKVVLGAGPVVSAPTATLSGLQTGSWAAGPTFVALTMPGPWVIGALVNNLWTFSDAGDEPTMNQFLLQPFVNFNFGKGWAIASVPLITANWDAESGQQWTVPIGAGISRTTVFSGRPMVLAVHYYHNVVHPDAAAGGQLRFMWVLLFPKK
jgi:hypothetical protein